MSLDQTEPPIFLPIVPDPQNPKPIRLGDGVPIKILPMRVEGKWVAPLFTDEDIRLRFVAALPSNIEGQFINIGSRRSASAILKMLCGDRVTHVTINPDPATGERELVELKNYLEEMENDRN